MSRSLPFPPLPRPRRAAQALAACVALATCAALAACSGSSSSSTSGTTPPAPAPSSPAPSSPAPSSPAPSSPAASPSAAAQPVPASLIGMHVDGIQAGAWPDLPVGAVRLWDNGTAWSQVETSPGAYSWGALDAAVATAEAHGVHDILLVLGSTPAWAATQVTPGDYPAPGAASPPRDPARWNAWVSAVAERFRGRIAAYQVWNEANLRNFWNGTPEQMADLTQRTADVVRRVDPQARVVAASTSTRTAAYDAVYPAYLAALAKWDWPVDVLAVHTYPPGPGVPEDRVGFLRRVQADIAAAGAPDLPLWDTEINYGLAGPGPDNPKVDITGARAAGWVARTYLDALREGVAAVYWYIWTTKPYDLLGIQMTDDSAGARGLRSVADWVVGARWEGCTTQGTVVTCVVERDGVRSTLAWTTRGTATVTAPDGATQRCTALGRCTPLAAGQDVLLSVSPVRLGP